MNDQLRDEQGPQLPVIDQAITIIVGLFIALAVVVCSTIHLAPLLVR